MSALRNEVRAAIASFVRNKDGFHTAADVLRVVQAEAQLLKETQDVFDLIDADPFERFDSIRQQLERFKGLLQVTSCSRVRSGFEYSSIDAVVSFEQCNHLQLTFKYERKPCRNEGTACQKLWYSIETSHNHGEREKMLVVQVFAPEGVPSTEPAVCMEPESGDDDEWSDMEEAAALEEELIEKEESPMIISEDEAPKNPNKKQRTSDFDAGETNATEQKEVEPSELSNSCDSFLVHLDPELLRSFVESVGIIPVDEATAFFLLMTFPYYEQEWDLIGYVLDEVFGEDECDGDEEVVDEDS